jgi:phage tail tape-measure protein
MSTIIAGRFDEEIKSRRAPEALAAAGFDEGHIAVFFINPAGQHGLHGTPDDADASVNAHHAGAGAVAGIAAGSGVGAVVGLAATPLVGPAAPIAGAAIGAYIGSLAGSVNKLGSPQSEDGEPDDDRNPPQEPAPHKSGFLVAVEADGADAQSRAADVLRNAGACELERAEGQIIDGKWDDFNPLTPPRVIA